MKSHFPIILVIILVIEAFAASGSFSQEPAEVISPIPPADMKHGCGCTYLLKPVDRRNYKFIFSSDLAFENPKMRIYGKTVLIEPVAVRQIPYNARVGDQFSQTYRYGSVELRFDNRIIFVCPKIDEECQVIAYDSELTVKEGDTRKVYQVQGDSGC